MTQPLSIVLVGLSLTSSWGNGHATTYRGLVRELCGLGHDVLFLERDVPWYRDNRDMPVPPWGSLGLYGSLEELNDTYGGELRDADLVVAGSYVPEGVAAIDLILQRARGAVAFYDIDTPVTLRALLSDQCAYLARRQIPDLDLYLSFTGGPTLQRLEREFGARKARALYCSVDPEVYHPMETAVRWAAGYLGTYSPDRQPALQRFLFEPALRLPARDFVVAGSMYPADVRWPANVHHLDHVPPGDHPAFYTSQKLTLNLTRRDMIEAGWSPSVRLFEAAACGTPIVTDSWPGIEELFQPGTDIIVAHGTADVLEAIRAPEHKLEAMAKRARHRVLARHTAMHRALEMEAHARQVLDELARHARPRGRPQNAAGSARDGVADLGGVNHATDPQDR